MKNFNQFNEKIKWYSKGKLKEDPDYKGDTPKDYDDFITNDFFRNFLISHGVCDRYLKYARNFITGGRESFKNCDPLEYINHAFTWSDDDEDLWEEMDTEWREYYGMKNLPIDNIDEDDGIGADDFFF